MQVQAPAHASFSRLKGLRSRIETLESPSLVALTILVILAGFYALEYQRYRAYDIDNSWFLAFTYSDFVSHIPTDTFMQIRFPGGMDGTHLFGKAAAFIQWVVLSRTGWLPLPGTAISKVFTLASLGFWWAALRKWELSPRLAVPFLVLVGVSEPVLSMAEKCRYEFFCFFLFSVALWLAASGRIFWALLVAFLAVETEPAAIVAPIIVLALLFPRVRSRRRLLWQTALAASLGFLLYLLLHPHGISAMLTTLAQKDHGDSTISFHSPLYGYFVERLRHIAELIAFVGGGWCFWKHRREVRFPGLGVATICCLLVLGFMPHDNVSYMVFLAPLLYLVALLGFDRASRWRWILYGAFLIGLAQDAYLYRINRHEGLSRSDIARVSGAITQDESKLHIDDANAQIVGDPALWFVHPSHYSARLFDPAVHGDLYLCFTGHLQKGQAQDSGEYTCSMLSARLPLQTVSSVTLESGHRVFLLAKPS